MSYETDLAELKKILFQDMKVKNFHFTPGPEATKESVVKELLKVMKALQNGDFEEADFHDENINSIDLKDVNRINKIKEKTLKIKDNPPKTNLPKKQFK